MRKQRYCLRAIPHNEARAFIERFWLKTKFRKRRNTVCIVSFLNCRIGAKDPVKAADKPSGIALELSACENGQKKRIWTNKVMRNVL